MTRLVYGGGATLTFGAGRDRRTVEAGAPFEVDDDTAAILLSDPAVHLAGAEDPLPPLAAAAGVLATADLPPGALRSRARESRRSASAAKVAEAEAAEAREAALAAQGTPEGGITMPASDPGAAAPGEAGTPPPDFPSGVIILGRREADR